MYVDNLHHLQNCILKKTAVSKSFAIYKYFKIYNAMYEDVLMYWIRIELWKSISAACNS